MKVKYIGPDMGATGPRNNGVYEVVEVSKDYKELLVIDECLSDFNYDDDPNWKPGYLYSATAPTLWGSPEHIYSGGKFYIVEDENGQLAKAGVPSLPN